MENFRYYIVLLSCFLLMACQEDVDHTRLVVEGWIDEGKHPIVLVHRSYSLHADNEPDSTTLADVIADQMVLFGKVAISDGIDTVVLTGKVDTNYMPPYIYTTVFMRGEAGRTYHLLATDHGFEASASTSIPYEKPVVDSFAVQYREGAFFPQLVAYASRLVAGEHYVVMTKTNPRGQYKICPLGVFEADKPQRCIDVKYYSIGGIDFGNINSLADSLQYDTIYIKLAHIGETEYQVFDSFVAQSITQGVFFMETHSNIETNIRNGNGYWCGMSANEYIVSLAERPLTLSNRYIIRELNQSFSEALGQ